MTTPESRGRFCKGWTRDTHPTVLAGKVPSARSLLGARRFGVGSFPGAASMEQYVDVVRDQLNTSACVGEASARVISVRCAAMGTPIPYPSILGIYGGARTLGLATPDAPLEDTGSQPYLAVQWMQKYGVASEAQYPFDPAKVNDKLTLDELGDAAAFLINGIYRIDATGADRVAEVQQALAANHPVMLGVEVDQAFEDYNGKGAVTAPNPDGFLGGHMLPLIGYQTSTAGAVTFRGVNSWNTSWGDNGFFWADSAWLEDPNAGDFYIMTVNAQT
jgi:Papain family cysteine protease